MEERSIYILPALADFEEYKFFYEDDSANFTYFCTKKKEMKYNWPVSETVANLMDSEATRVYTALYGPKYVVKEVFWLFSFEKNNWYEEFSSFEQAEEYVNKIIESQSK